MPRWVDLDNPKIIKGGRDKFGNVLYSVPPDIQTADVREVERGKWIDGEGSPVGWDENDPICPKNSCYCSECGKWLTASDEYFTIGNYCPNCGAVMREPPKEET